MKFMIVVLVTISFGALGGKKKSNEVVIIIDSSLLISLVLDS